jgi:hypothetical protein
VDVLKLRYSDPETLSDRDLMTAAHKVAEDRERVGPDRMRALLRELLDRYELTWTQAAAVTGYPMTTVFRMTR